MLRYIQESPLSKVFYLEDFAQCGSYTSIRSEIVRMEQKSILVRLARGLYMNSIGYNSMNMNYLIEIILEDFPKDIMFPFIQQVNIYFTNLDTSMNCHNK